jgi:hypothetical protein
METAAEVRRDARRTERREESKDGKPARGKRLQDVVVGQDWKMIESINYVSRLTRWLKRKRFGQLVQSPALSFCTSP